MLLVSCTIIFTACGMGGNEDFEYMKQGNIMTVTIQSTRDNKYKFSVTDKSLINDIYSILSNATVVNSKSDLEPDYILQIYESPTEVKTFNYIAGLDKSDGANLYNNDSYYIVSKRLDTDIIKNFTNMRKPLNFEEVYYNSIINCLDVYKSTAKVKGEIGVDIVNDSTIARFQLSTDLEDFKSKLNKEGYKYIDSSQDTSVDIVAKVKTKGYTSKKYKAIVTFENKADGTSIDYYIDCVYTDGQWMMKSTDAEPEGF